MMAQRAAGEELMPVFVSDNDPDGPLAQNARKWFGDKGPPDLQPLPLGYAERERLKHGGADHILAWYARSLDFQDYDIQAHPSFFDYACGVMASEFAPYFIKNNEKLKKRFPPRELAGIGPGMNWEPSKAHAETMRSYRRSRARQAEANERSRANATVHHTPIGEAVEIPESVRRAAAAANAIHQLAYPQHEN
jgi:hypothetical protein